MDSYDQTTNDCACGESLDDFGRCGWCHPVLRLEGALDRFEGTSLNQADRDELTDAVDTLLASGIDTRYARLALDRAAALLCIFPDDAAGDLAERAETQRDATIAAMEAALALVDVDAWGANDNALTPPSGLGSRVWGSW